MLYSLALTNMIRVSKIVSYREKLRALVIKLYEKGLGYEFEKKCQKSYLEIGWLKERFSNV